MWRTIFLVITVCMLPVACIAQPLWQKTQLGMTTAQVSAQYPTAAACDKHSKLPDGFVDQLCLASVQVDGHPFKVAFQFKSDGLGKVVLKLNDNETTYSALSLYGSLITALRSKYGVETSHANHDLGLTTKRDITWVDGGTKISIGFLAIGPADAHISITYQSRIEDAAQNL